MEEELWTTFTVIKGKEEDPAYIKTVRLPVSKSEIELYSKGWASAAEAMPRLSPEEIDFVDKGIEPGDHFFDTVEYFPPYERYKRRLAILDTKKEED